MAFIHLRTHTEFSVVDGTLRIYDAVGGALRIEDGGGAAAKDGPPALGISDLSNMFGGVKFYSTARKKGVKPILGADVWLEPDAALGEKNPSRLLLLVMSKDGYLNLC